MRVFVLSTGRCGSTTFARASGHLTNYTAGHETRAGMFGDARTAYPDQHVEVDNRLAWLLGDLDRTYGDDAFYVHLRRDPEATAHSFARRWNYRWRGGIIEAFAHGILQHADDWPTNERLDVCRFYVHTVNANIENFLSRRPHTATVDLELGAEGFARVWERIGGVGDGTAALAEWQVRHNASPVVPAPPS